MSEHTPGPWIIEDDTIRFPAKEIASDQSDICYINTEAGSPESDWFGDSRIAEANARLIAAAPELLEALLQCDPGEEYEIDDDMHDSGAFCELTVKDMRAIRKAIAKATGKESA